MTRRSFSQANGLILCSGLLLSLLVGLAAPSTAGNQDLVLEDLVGGLSGVLDIATAGDDRVFLIQQDGTILIWDGTQILPQPFMDLSGIIGGGFEGGLLSLIFHPDHASNGFFFVKYSDPSDNAVVERYEVMAGDPNQGDPATGNILLSIPHFGGHYGSSLLFGPDGYLYFGLGDGGEQQDPSCRAQNTGLLQGKILRIDVDENVDTPPFHGIPASNPFVGDPQVPDEVWAIGFRNPWRLSFDDLTGDLYIADVGQNTREEVSFQPAASAGGENYGWKIMEGTFCHDPDPIDTDCPKATASCFDASYVPPILEYDQLAGDCSVTGGYVYRGSLIGGIIGRYVYGDWCSGNIWAAERSGSTWTPELLNVSLNSLTSWGQGADGELYLTNTSNLFRLSSPGAVYADGFESGDTLGWSDAAP